MTTVPEGDGWSEWRIHILAEMKRFSEGQQAVLNTLASLPCSAHETQIELLQKETQKSTTNWDRLITIGLGITQALIIAWLLMR